MSSLSFHYLSMAVHSMIQKNFMEQVKSSGLTSGQPKVLDYLRDHNGANQKEIAAACHIEPGSLTSVLNRMEENGLIERRMLDGNRRTFYIFIKGSFFIASSIISSSKVKKPPSVGLLPYMI